VNLSTAQRAALPRSEFVFPDRAPGHGAYPIPDRAQGTADASAVRKAVKAKFGIG
jgi:hypothetical protein